MNKYELLGTVGEGTYGVVVKARVRSSRRLVAVKGFREKDTVAHVRKTALREVRLLKNIRHENIVELIEAVRRKSKLYLVFEYVQRTLLEDLERRPDGLDTKTVKRYVFQLLRAVAYLHQVNVMHRDLKPENVLISRHGVLKLCDFGFARACPGPSTGDQPQAANGPASRQGLLAPAHGGSGSAAAVLTDYVSTRWYRAPELLVGDPAYGMPVDVWAAGCLAAELCNGLALFPGKDDADQLSRICACLGPLPERLGRLQRESPHVRSAVLPSTGGAPGSQGGSQSVPQELHPETLAEKLPGLDPQLLDLIGACVRLDPAERATAGELLQHPFFSGFATRFMPKLSAAMRRDAAHYLGRQQASGDGSSGKGQDQGHGQASGLHGDGSGDGKRSGVVIGATTSGQLLPRPHTPLAASGKGSTSQPLPHSHTLVSPETGRPVPLPGNNGSVWPPAGEGSDSSGAYGGAASLHPSAPADVLPAPGVLMTQSVVDDESGSAPWMEDSRSGRRKRRGSGMQHGLSRSMGRGDHFDEGIGLQLQPGIGPPDRPPGAVSEVDSVRSDFSRISYLTAGTAMTQGSLDSVSRSSLPGGEGPAASQPPQLVEPAGSAADSVGQAGSQPRAGASTDKRVHVASNSRGKGRARTLQQQQRIYGGSRQHGARGGRSISIGRTRARARGRHGRRPARTRSQSRAADGHAPSSRLAQGGHQPNSSSRGAAPAKQGGGIAGATGVVGSSPDSSRAGHTRGVEASRAHRSERPSRKSSMAASQGRGTTADGNESEDSLDREDGMGPGEFPGDAADDGPDRFVLGEEDPSGGTGASSGIQKRSRGGRRSGGGGDGGDDGRPSWLVEEQVDRGADSTTRTHASESFTDPGVADEDGEGDPVGRAGGARVGRAESDELSHGRAPADGRSDGDASRSLRGSVQDQRSIESLVTQDRHVAVSGLLDRQGSGTSLASGAVGAGAGKEAFGGRDGGGDADAGVGVLGSTGGLDEMPSIVSVTSVRTSDSGQGPNQGRRSRGRGERRGGQKQGQQKGPGQRHRDPNAVQASPGTERRRLRNAGRDGLPRLRIGVGQSTGDRPPDGRRSAASPSRDSRDRSRPGDGEEFQPLLSARTAASEAAQRSGSRDFRDDPRVLLPVAAGSNGRQVPRSSRGKDVIIPGAGNNGGADGVSEGLGLGLGHRGRPPRSVAFVSSVDSADSGTSSGGAPGGAGVNAPSHGRRGRRRSRDSVGAGGSRRDVSPLRRPGGGDPSDRGIAGGRHSRNRDSGSGSVHGGPSGSGSDPLADTGRTHVSELGNTATPSAIGGGAGGGENGLSASQSRRQASGGEEPWSPLSAAGSGAGSVGAVGSPMARAARGKWPNGPDALDRQLMQHQQHRGEDLHGQHQQHQKQSFPGSAADREGLASRGTILEVDVTDGGMRYSTPGAGGQSGGSEAGRHRDRPHRGSFGIAAVGMLAGGSQGAEGVGLGLQILHQGGKGHAQHHHHGSVHRRGLSDGLAFAGLHDAMMPAVGEEQEEDELEGSMSGRGSRGRKQSRGGAGGRGEGKDATRGYGAELPKSLTHGSPSDGPRHGRRQGGQSKPHWDAAQQLQPPRERGYSVPQQGEVLGRSALLMSTAHSTSAAQLQRQHQPSHGHHQQQQQQQQPHSTSRHQGRGLGLQLHGEGAGSGSNGGSLSSSQDLRYGGPVSRSSNANGTAHQPPQQSTRPIPKSAHGAPSQGGYNDRVLRTGLVGAHVRGIDGQPYHQYQQQSHRQSQPQRVHTGHGAGHSHAPSPYAAAQTLGPRSRGGRGVRGGRRMPTPLVGGTAGAGASHKRPGGLAAAAGYSSGARRQGLPLGGLGAGGAGGRRLGGARRLPSGGGGLGAGGMMHLGPRSMSSVQQAGEHGGSGARGGVIGFGRFGARQELVRG